MMKSMNGQHQAAYLQAMGIQTWVRKGAASRAVASRLPEPVAQMPAAEVKPAVQQDPYKLPPIKDVSQLGWDELRAMVSSCTACSLHETRTQTVFGAGNQQAQWMIIGEAPGAEEDRQGEPFVGRAGQLLNNMLKAVDLSREQVYIANILKCRPPDNRDPRPAEISQCESYLRRQVELVQPKVILAVGRIAAHSLLKSNDPLSRIRGKLHHYRHNKGETPLVVTYHPAYLLRTPRDKAKAWEDLRLALRVSREELSP